MARILARSTGIPVRLGAVRQTLTLLALAALVAMAVVLRTLGIIADEFEMDTQS